MKLIYKKGLRNMWSQFNLTLSSVIICALFLTFTYTPLKAQAPKYTKPTWWFGGAVGANFNFFNGSIQRLNADKMAPVAFHQGFGLGLFAAPLIEFHRPDSRWGMMLQAGYDGRSGKFGQEFSPCNCPRDLSTKISYLTIEPSLRFAPFKSNFYLYAGPRFAFNMAKSFTYKEGPNPEIPDQKTNPDFKGDLSDMKKTIISMQIGAGYDIELNSQNKRVQYVLSPFIAYHPYFGQEPRSIETWNVSTLRAGVAFKFGRGSVIPVDSKEENKKVSVIESKFTVNSPENIAKGRAVREVFPLRNYVFFDLGSTEIPNRYVLLNKSQVKEFKEDNVELFTPKNLSGRSQRQMVVYYNVLNILGDRMSKNPLTSINLVGSSDQGQLDGLAMSESVKKYLVDVFGIDPIRIKTEGRDKPKLPSDQGQENDIVMLKEGDRRVSIESNSPVLLMEFQSGPAAPLKPVEFIRAPEVPLDSYLTFNNTNANDVYTSWSLEIKDEKGKTQYFGPYTGDKVTLSGQSVLGTRPEGDFKVTMVGQSVNKTTVRKDTNIHVVLWTASKTVEVTRFSIIYEFNEAIAINIYEKYLTEIVMPKIPIGGTVIIKGYSDIIGDSEHNLKLSLARANDVRSIIEAALAKAGRTDVKFEVYGYGEDENLSQFENKYPEQRFYNRSVVVDIIPAN